MGCSPEHLVFFRLSNATVSGWTRLHGTDTGMGTERQRDDLPARLAGLPDPSAGFAGSVHSSATGPRILTTSLTLTDLIKTPSKNICLSLMGRELFLVHPPEGHHICMSTTWRQADPR